MKKQLTIINDFCLNSGFFMIKYNDDKGKILSVTDLPSVDVEKCEVHRSLEYNNDNFLFVHELKEPFFFGKIDNPIQLLVKNLEEINIIEAVYPGIFKWCFNGLVIKGYAIIPSGDPKSNTTITRYGGRENFFRILNQHLTNIRKMRHGKTPDFDFLKTMDELPKTELSVGSINQFNKLYSVFISPKMSYKDILNASKNGSDTYEVLNVLDMKYWSREINPDFIVEAKHLKLDTSISIEEGFKNYPPCVKNLMQLKHKGNLNRFKLAKFLLSCHKPHDAKFIFYSVLADEEREHLKTGNCSGQWNYITNNFKSYNCPSCKEMNGFCDKKCVLSHPLEQIHDTLIKSEKNDE